MIKQSIIPFCLIISLAAFPAFASAQILIGDINSDGVVNIQDYALLSKAFGTQPVDDLYDDRADLFDDNRINIQDYALLSAHFGESATPTLTPTPIVSSDYQRIILAFEQIRTQTVWPVQGLGLDQLNSAFGPRIRVSTGNYDFHAGVDIEGPYRTSVLAPLDGILWDVVNYTNGGITVILRHQFPQSISYLTKNLNYYYTLYMHLDSVTQTLIDANIQNQHPHVSKGFEIGKLGHSGNAIDDHLHWELRVGTWCSLEFQLANPSSSCSGYGFDPAMNSLLLFPPTKENATLSVTVYPTAITDGKVLYTSSPNAPLLNRIDFQIIEKASGQIVKTHILDYNMRTGFNATSATSLDTQDKTKPYMSPIAFGVDNPEYNTEIIIPKTFVTGFTGSAYAYKLVATSIWGSVTQIIW